MARERIEQQFEPVEVLARRPEIVFSKRRHARMQPVVDPIGPRLLTHDDRIGEPAQRARIVAVFQRQVGSSGGAKRPRRLRFERHDRVDAAAAPLGQHHLGVGGGFREREARTRRKRRRNVQIRHAGHALSAARR